MTSGSAHGKSKLFVTDDRQCIIRHIIYFKPLNYFEKLDFENILLGAGVFIWDSWEQFSNNHMSAVQSVTVQLFGSLSIGT